MTDDCLIKNIFRGPAIMETPIPQRSRAWLAALTVASASVFALGACGGSNPAQPAASGSAQDSQAQPVNQPDSGTPSTPANQDASNDAPNAGFQVGTTTYDPALPPEPAMPADAQVCATLGAKFTARPDGL